jgi:hypothetical protein
MQKLLFFLLIFSALSSSAQVKYPMVDKSPLDISYYPVNYPVLKAQDKTSEQIVARVIYSRPQKNGRTIFGDLIAYGKVWRLGANEATELEFFQNVVINKVRVKKGRYTLFAIPDENKWTMILNKETDTWGSFKYDEKKDVVRVDVQLTKTSEPNESLGMIFSKEDASKFYLNIAWEDIQVSLPISL